MAAINGFVAGCADDADFFDSALKRLFGNDLKDRLCKAIAIDDRKHRLLHRVRCRVLSRPPPRRGNHRSGNLHVASPLLPRYQVRQKLGNRCAGCAAFQEVSFQEA